MEAFRRVKRRRVRAGLRTLLSGSMPDDSGFRDWFYERLRHIHTIGLDALTAIAVTAAIASKPGERALFAVISTIFIVLSILNHLVPTIWHQPWYLLPLAALVGLRLHWAVFSSDEGLRSVLDTLPSTSSFARVLLSIGGGLIATKPVSVVLERVISIAMALSGLIIGAIVLLRVGDLGGFTFALNFSCLPLCMFLTRIFVAATVQPLWLELEEAKQHGGKTEPEPPPPAKGRRSLLPAGAGEAGGGRRVSMNDFEVVGYLGAGGSSQVHLVQRVGELPQRLFALKAVRKNHLSARRVAEESRILQTLRHPFIVGLHYAFEDEIRLYLVLSYAGGGDLLAQLERHGRVAEPAARLCFAEVVSALSYLHTQQVLYRDLKPENLLLGHDGHILLADFGVSKRLVQQQRTQQQTQQQPRPPLDRKDSSGGALRDGTTPHRACCGDAATSTMVGTPAYMAPEVVLGHEYSYAADWWSAGILLHELLTNEAPFSDQSIAGLWNHLRRPGLCFRVSAEDRKRMSEAACDLIEKLLVADASARASWRPLPHSSHSLAVSSTKESVMVHPFFGDLSWSQLDAKQLDAPFPPGLQLDSESIGHEPSGDNCFEYYEAHNEASTRTSEKAHVRLRGERAGEECG